jgi:arginine N-succinyltransferase
VDPFDGGPHFTAMTDEITLVKASQRVTITSLLDSSVKAKTRGLVAVEPGMPPWFRSVLAPIELVGEGACTVGSSEANALGVNVGDHVWILPLD